MRELYKILIATLSDIAGVVIEDKSLTISVHYRAVAACDIAKVKQIFEKVTAVPESQGRIVLTGGKKVYEVRPPVKWGKGEAVRWLIDHTGVKTGFCIPPLCIYIGDDLTDEGAFEEVDKNGGISLFVGKPCRCSAAQYYVPDVKKVHKFLEML